MDMTTPTPKNTSSRRMPPTIGKHGFQAPSEEAVRNSLILTFSVGIFEILATKSGERTKKGRVKVRIQGPSHSYNLIIATAHKVADLLDAGTYEGPRVYKV